VSFTLTVVYAECRKLALHAECHFAECHYAGCRGAQLLQAGPKTLTFIGLNIETNVSEIAIMFSCILLVVRLKF
jgi:hypothetical protein